MKRSDFKIGFSKLTYIILHTITKQRTPVPTGVLCLKPYLITVLLKHKTLLSQYFYTGHCCILHLNASAYIFIFLNYIPRNSLTTLGISSTSQVAL